MVFVYFGFIVFYVRGLGFDMMWVFFTCVVWSRYKRGSMVYGRFAVGSFGG